MFSADIKSLVWYRPDVFAAKGYEVPTTWDEMEALMEQMVANGDTPWAIGLESGAASGWPATDWIEDIMLRTAGPDVYDQWVNHEIPWTDPRVQEAFEIFRQDCQPTATMSTADLITVCPQTSATPLQNSLPIRPVR
jgi:alpha-glucoside transport system substrate-binding protein